MNFHFSQKLQYCHARVVGHSTGQRLFAVSQTGVRPHLLDPARTGGESGQSGQPGESSPPDRENFLARDSGGLPGDRLGTPGGDVEYGLRAAHGGPVLPRGGGGAMRRTAAEPGGFPTTPFGAHRSRPTSSCGQRQTSICRSMKPDILTCYQYRTF